MTDPMQEAFAYLASRRATGGPKSNVALPAELSIAALFDLKGQVAVITNVGGGGSSEIARLLAGAGAQVILADHVIGPAQTLAAEIRETGGIAAALPVDIEREAEVCAAFARIAETTGRFDIVINCAGMSGHKSLCDTSLALWDDIQSLNLRANFLSMREAVRQMAALERGGRILNVTTIGGLHPVLHGNGVYGAARIGVKALGESVALDHAKDGVLVNTLMVGVVSNRTLTHPDIAAEMRAGRALTGPAADPQRALLGRGELVDVAAAVLFLVSPASRYITGQSLVLDGGFLLS